MIDRWAWLAHRLQIYCFTDCFMFYIKVCLYCGLVVSVLRKGWLHTIELGSSLLNLGLT